MVVGLEVMEVGVVVVEETVEEIEEEEKVEVSELKVGVVNEIGVKLGNVMLGYENEVYE